MNILTSGMIKSFIDCPEKYRLIYKEHIEIPYEQEFSDIGKQIHSIIKYYYDGWDLSKIIDSIKKQKNLKILSLWENFLSFNVENVIFSEYSFNTKLSDNDRLTGRIDAIAYENEKYEIWDWKTGKASNIDVESDPQTMVYMYCLFNVLYDENKIQYPEQLSMTYCFLQEKVCQQVLYTKEKHLKYKKKLLLYANQISSFQNSVVANQNFSKCKTCNFKIVCKGTYEQKLNML